MKKVLLLLAAFALIWVFQPNVNVACAHGGRYRGPAGEVPPGQRNPSDPQPPPANPGGTTPPAGGGPVTPGGNGNSTPSGNPGNPSGSGQGQGNPGAPVGPAQGNGGGLTPNSKGRNAPKAMSFSNWLFWWAYNKDEILNLKAAVKRNAAHIPTKSGMTSFGGGESNAGRNAPAEQRIKDEIVPALKEVLKNENINSDIRGGALIALARCRGVDSRDIFFKMSKRGNHEDKVVYESAIIALGIAQCRGADVRNFLVKIVDDRDYPPRGRCFAMISLGLLKDNSLEVINCLKRRLDGSEKVQDIPVCALLSLGLIGDNKIVPDMTNWLEKGRIGRHELSKLERAWVVSALGKIGDPRALKPVADMLRRRVGQYTQRSAMIAMGQLIPAASPKEQVAYLHNFGYALNQCKDPTARSFGMIALGRIGGSSKISESLRKVCTKMLVSAFSSGKTLERPFAALSLGLVGFSTENNKKPAELRYELADTIFSHFKELKGDKTALGAEAISLGMLADNRKPTVKKLVSILEDRGQEKKLRGAAAMALGLIGDPAAKPAIMAALKERNDRDLRVDTAIAAGLLGDSTAVPTLVKVLNDPRATQYSLGSVALALGQIGDQQAIDTLIKILEPEKVNGVYPEITRALVTVALGQIADQSDIRVLARISTDINYRASVPSLDEVLSIF